MYRRRFASLLLALPLIADSRQDVWEALTAMASALGRGSAAAFAAGLDPAMPGYEALRNDVAAMLRQVDVQCSLDLVENSGDDTARTVQVDWVLVLTERAEAQRVTRRRQTVRCRFVRRGKKWLLEGMDPAGFLKV